MAVVPISQFYLVASVMTDDRNQRINGISMLKISVSISKIFVGEETYCSQQPPPKKTKPNQTTEHHAFPRRQSALVDAACRGSAGVRGSFTHFRSLSFIRQFVSWIQSGASLLSHLRHEWRPLSSALSHRIMEPRQRTEDGRTLDDVKRSFHMNERLW